MKEKGNRLWEKITRETYIRLDSPKKYSLRKECLIWHLKGKKSGLRFPGGAVDKNLPDNTGDTGSSPGPGRSHMLWKN